MKLGCGYNIFDDSLELLSKSLKSIRESVDYISVVYQDVSNYGNPAEEDIEKLLIDLISQGLVDEYIKYRPVLKHGPHSNEVSKRNLGLYLAKTNGCTHFMSMDSDEVYKKEELEYAKKTIEDNDYDTSYCGLETYWREDYVLRPREDYYVSLIHKIDDREFVFGINVPIVIDPTRRMVPKKYIIFKEDEILMHHYSHIRKNYRRKLENSSALVNFKDKVNELCDYYDTWKPGMDAFVPGMPPKKIQIRKNMKLKQLLDGIFGDKPYFESDPKTVYSLKFDELKKIKDQLLLCDEFKNVTELIILDLPYVSNDGNNQSVITRKMTDDSRFINKLYLYEISLTPLLFDVFTIDSPIKEGSSITPVFINPYTFETFRTVKMRIPDDRNNAHALLDKILDNPQDYQQRGLRFPMITGIWQLENKLKENESIR